MHACLLLFFRKVAWIQLHESSLPASVENMPTDGPLEAGRMVPLK